jgi:mannose-6-phosphate isomerase-like protein (cupin superfamily)
MAMVEEHLRWAGIEVLVKASAADTGGALTILEEDDPVDTPLHIHEHEDETFVVLEGEHVFQIGDREITAGPGDVVFGPRGVPHSQRRVVPRTGRVLIVMAPGGIEGFFRELVEGHRDGTPSEDVYAAASRRYGLTWV